MLNFETFGIDQSQTMAAKCPHCGKPHRYTNLRHPAENDPGYWEVKCSECEEMFCITGLSDVYSSDAEPDVCIVNKVEDGDRVSAYPTATDALIYRLDLNRLELAYDLTSCALYECICGQSLDEAAYVQLSSDFDEVSLAYANVLNYALKGSLSVLYVTVDLAFDCTCGVSHTAKFYTRLVPHPDKRPALTDYILADVSGVDLGEVLDGVRSKTDAMDLLAKLILRWNLCADSILIASPFVGHQYMAPAKQMETWKWLLGLLDPQLAVFLTRSTTWTNYRNSMANSGLPLDVLDEFGLGNRLVAAGHRKQDFHAKFYVGMSQHACEVYSGSANLVRGPSMENTSFRRMNRDSFDRRYLSKMRLKQPLPTPSTKASARSYCIYRSPAVEASASQPPSDEQRT